MASVMVESKSADTPAETIQVREASDDVPGSSVDTMGEPQGNKHITVLSSLGVEASDDVPVSTTMTTSTALRRLLLRGRGRTDSTYRRYLP